MENDENYPVLSLNEVRQINRVEHEKSGMKITIELDSIKELDLLRRRASQAELASEQPSSSYLTIVPPTMLKVGDLVETVFVNEESGFVNQYQVWRVSV